ncbi:MAG: PadR family transcriptional regulator, partial [Coleofasciculaceae cyanobacterium]
RIILLQHRLKICQLRQATLEVEATPLDNHYASTAWQRALDTLSSEIEWLGEQLANEATQLCEL